MCVCVCLWLLAGCCVTTIQDCGDTIPVHAMQNRHYLVLLSKPIGACRTCCTVHRFDDYITNAQASVCLKQLCISLTIPTTRNRNLGVDGFND